ncbi:MAG: hypothetical protein JXA42_08350, partial [Anaerolineales bacterium]|nr:hypothetical protein [Anaerolineales bacterium]
SYIWVALLGAGAVYSGVRFLETRTVRKRVWATAYTLISAAGLYTHYLFPISLIPIGVIAVIRTIRQKAWRLLGSFLGINLLAALLYLPWAPTGIDQLLGWPSAGGSILLGPALLETWRTLTLGVTIGTAEAVIALAGFGLVLLLGMVPAFWRKDEPGRPQPENGQSLSPNAFLSLTILWLLVPIVLVFVFNLYKPAFLKFLLIASPAVCLLLGRGATRLFISRRPTPLLFAIALSIGLILSFSLESLENLYHDSAYARADYRGMAHAILENTRWGGAKENAVILDAANQWEVFTYYYPYPDQTFPLPKSRPVNEARVIAQLEEIAAQHDRIYALFWAEAESDPDHLVERWLDTHTYKAADEWWSDVRLVAYAVPDQATTEMAVPLDVRAGNSIELLGYTLLEDHLLPGEIIRATLFWRTAAPIDQRYKVFLHLLDGNETLAAQRDSEPGGGSNPTNSWVVNETQIDNHGILIPLDTTPGPYNLIVGLYPPDDPTNRLPIILDGQPAGDKLLLHTIHIEAP